MKHFVIRYRFANGTAEDWHAEIERYTAACEGVAADADVTVTPLTIVAETTLRG